MQNVNVAKKWKNKREEKKMKKKENQKGITLIALVITIIVLLILAAVSIATLTGENGILTKAKEAKEKTELASKKEETQVNILEQIIENGGETKKTADKIVDNLKNEIGSYVEYNVDLNNDNDYTNDWKLFYAGNESGEDRLFLIAADYVPTNNTNLVEAMESAKMKKATSEGYENLSVNWNDNALEYQTISNAENFFKLIMYNTPDNENKEANCVKCVSTLLNPENWEGFKSDKAEYVIGGPTLEMWIAAWNATNPTKDEFVELDAEVQNNFGYFWGKKGGKLHYDWLWVDGIRQTDNKDYKMSNLKLEILKNKYSTFFPHTQWENIVANGATGNCGGYWIASPRAINDKDPISIEWIGQVIYCDYNDSFGRAVRPLVCLKRETNLYIKDIAEDGNKIYGIEE